jgi:hypothetical protein
MKPIKLISLLSAFAVILVLTLSLVGCTNTHPHPHPNVETKPTEHRLEGYLGATNPLVEVKIDGCEYLYGPWGNATVLTHKGNCNNPIHSKGGRYTEWNN